MTTTAALADALRAIVGAGHVVERPSELLVYESDALPGYHKRPSVAVFPGSRAETVDVVRLLAREGVAFVPRGAGTGLSGGALADGVVLLGLQRLKRIIAIDPIARTAVAEPGVVNATLTAAASGHGLHYAPDPSSQTACTIGGNVAENAGGPHCLKYGVTLNHVLGASVILASGEEVVLRAPSSPADGYDLLGAFVGSEGCFGVALDVTVRLTPNAEDVRTLLADYSSIDGAARTVSAIVASGIVPAACELMDHGTIEAVEASIYAAGYPRDAAAVLLVELDGSAASVAEDASRVEAICREHGARSVRSASSASDRAKLWQGRKKAFGAMGRVAPNLVVQDAVVPRTKLAEILADIGAIGARQRIRICNVFHAGDGNLHPNIPYNGRDPDESARVHAAMGEIMTRCIDAGGTITGEHGVGLDKLPYVERMFTADTLDAMCRLRDAFDDSRRANPGKVVPVRACREWHGSSPRRDPQQPGNTEHAERARGNTDTATPFERDVADTIAIARAAGRCVYVAGTGTRVSEAPRGADVIHVRRHGGVVEYVPGDLTITVNAGMSIAELDAITAEHGQWCPLFAWGRDASTIGGALASGARGPAARAFGSARDLALGVRFVDGRGAVVAAGGRVVKNVAGFDLTRLMIGSWGTLGVITAASLRLRALPRANETLAVNVAEAGASRLDAFARGPLAPAARVRVDASLAAELGLTAEPHEIVWLAGGTAEIEAARTALRALGPVRGLPADAWALLRARGPFDACESNIEQSAALARLNERVRRAFDPDAVFAAGAAIGAEAAMAHV